MWDVVVARLPPAVAEGDRATYWFFYFRLELAKLTCPRNEFADALRAEGVACEIGRAHV